MWRARARGDLTAPLHQKVPRAPPAGLLLAAGREGGGSLPTYAVSRAFTSHVYPFQFCQQLIFKCAMGHCWGCWLGWVY